MQKCQKVKNLQANKSVSSSLTKLVISFFQNRPFSYSPVCYFATIHQRYFTRPHKLWVTPTWPEKKKLTQKLWRIVTEQKWHKKINNIKMKNKQQNLEKRQLDTLVQKVTLSTMTTRDKKRNDSLFFVTNRWLSFRNLSNKTSSLSSYRSVSYTETHPAAMTQII